MSNHDSNATSEAASTDTKRPLRNDVPVRLPADLTDRAECLVPVVTEYMADVRAVLGTVTRLAVLRMALARGLDSIEAECKGKGWTSVKPETAPE